MADAPKLKMSGSEASNDVFPAFSEGSGAAAGNLGSGASADITRLIANLTHELKTPLHSMLATAGLLAAEVDGPLNSEQKRQIEIITRNGKHLLELITELLQFSSIASETRRVNARQINLRELFEDILRSIQPFAEKSAVSLEWDLVRLEGSFSSDQTLLRRICDNLLSNAVKFSPGGGLVSFYAERLNDGSLYIQVADSGIGIRKSLQKDIFSEFFQVEAGDARRFSGVGLGLALVKTAISLLGGKIEVQSEPGKGSLFSLRIPSAQALEQQRSILIFDSDQGVRLSLEECFTKEGYLTYVASCADDVKRIIAAEPIELLVIDVSKSDLGGFALVEEIRQASWGETLPIIAMSTIDRPGERAQGFKAGVSDFMVKPFDLEELLARVRRQLERPW